MGEGEEIADVEEDVLEFIIIKKVKSDTTLQ
jgi:hypothetical protein